LRRVAVCQFDDSDGYGNREIVIFECVAQTLDIVADANDGAALVLPFRTKNIHELRNNYTEACWFSLQHLLAEKQDILTITSQMRDKEIARKTK